MVATISVKVIAFLALVPGVAMCQQNQGNARVLLPDAPSVQASSRADMVRFSGNEFRPLFTHNGVSSDTAILQESERASSTFARIGENERGQKPSNDFLEKYLRRSLLKPNLNGTPSTSDSLLGRATFAASRIVIMKDDSGNNRLNTPYLLSVLSSAAFHTAYRPYWRRSVSGPFSDFGSTVGNDAGMNLFHEFGPGLQQLVRNHTPKFVSKIEQHLTH